MRAARYSVQYRKDLKLMQKRGKDMSKLLMLMTLLEDETPLDPAYKDHALFGKFAGQRECHVEPDWLLVYRIESTDDGDEGLYYIRTGTHTDLFKM